MSNRFCVKFTAEPETQLEDEATLIPIFHDWIRERKIPGVLLDVVDYSHVPEGPGIMLITHEINYAMEHTGGEYGLSAQLKIAEGETHTDRLVNLIQRTAQFGTLLEADSRIAGQIKLQSDRFYYIANDRLNLPNTDETFDQIKGDLEAAAATIYPGKTVTVTRVENDPRERLTALVVAV
ncbi:MAG: hypothetical protein AAGG51_20260 [Cyanobacteria bacterium P01_G01_bin.54]